MEIKRSIGLLRGNMGQQNGRGQTKKTKRRGRHLGNDRIGGRGYRWSRQEHKFVGSAELDGVFRPLKVEVETANAAVRPAANAKLDELKQEVAKGKAANDGVVAKLIDGMVALVPNAASAVVSAFATPLLAGITGPVTTFVLEKLQGDG